MKIFISFLLVFIKYGELKEITTLFNCTFDDGLIDDCIFNGILPLGDSLEIDKGQNTIDLSDRPLSDATSVFSPTMNGEMCTFPYDLNGSDMHFCLYDENTMNSTCPTESGNQTCAKGQYGYKTTSDPNGFLAIYKSTTLIVTNSTNEQHCLSFYYHFTNIFGSPYITFRMRPNSNTMDGEIIVTVKPNYGNKWHYSQTSFTPIAEKYYLVFVLYRSRDFDVITNFTFALDNISIINGSCFNTTNDSITTDSSISTETSTITTHSNTYTTDKQTITSTIGSSVTFDNQENETTTATSLINTNETNIITSSTTTKLADISSTTISTSTSTIPSTYVSTTTSPDTTTISLTQTSTTTSTVVSITTTTHTTATRSTRTSPTTSTDFTITATTRTTATRSTRTTASRATRASTTTSPRTTATRATHTSTGTSADTSTTKPKPKNLPLILGLSLGLGIPTLLTIIAIVVYIVKFVLK
ncbi:unnamed protein product [Adineta steineri]|uniref:MAM domain-containing protein n=1 Tax=Adineta steineri TaxID=433720 RepID=A0A818Q992_9BILA|nr:unnamed protein product [Adineta steineri]